VHLGLVGRRTGVNLRDNVLKDCDDLDNIEDFFASSDEDDGALNETEAMSWDVSDDPYPPTQIFVPVPPNPQQFTPSQQTPGNQEPISHTEKYQTSRQLSEKGRDNRNCKENETDGADWDVEPVSLYIEQSIISPYRTRNEKTLEEDRSEENTQDRSSGQDEDNHFHSPIPSMSWGSSASHSVCSSPMPSSGLSTPVHPIVEDAAQTLRSSHSSFAALLPLYSSSMSSSSPMCPLTGPDHDLSDDGFLLDSSKLMEDSRSVGRQRMEGRSSLPHSAHDSIPHRPASSEVEDITDMPNQSNNVQLLQQIQPSDKKGGRSPEAEQLNLLEPPLVTSPSSPEPIIPAQKTRTTKIGLLPLVDYDLESAKENVNSSRDSFKSPKPVIKTCKKGSVQKEARSLAEKSFDPGDLSPVAQRLRRLRKAQLKRLRKTPKSKNKPSTYSSVSVAAAVPDQQGLRRSTRTRILPLQFWRNERVVYKPYCETDGLPAIAAVIRRGPSPLTNRRFYCRSQSNRKGKGQEKKY
jgi:hypothetical protein